MKLLGNHRDWIQQEWVDYCLLHTGQRMPKDYYHTEQLQHATHDVGEKLTWFTDWGIDPTTTFLERFDEGNLPFQLDFSWLPEKNVRWGILKYKPGGYMPLHSDDVRFEKERRLWMPMQDYIEGHVVLHGQQYFKDWQAGDLFHFTAASAKHGAANISGVTRLVFTIVVFPDQT